MRSTPSRLPYRTNTMWLGVPRHTNTSARPGVCGAIRTVFALLVLAPALCFAGKDFVKPVVQSAKDYPARDEHPTEHVTAAVDPYDMADKAQIFSVKYRDEGYMPILLIITNDGDQPISLNNMNAQLVTVNRSKLLPATSDDLYRRLSHPAQSNVPCRSHSLARR